MCSNVAMILRLFYLPGFSTTISFRNHRFFRLVKGNRFLSYLKDEKEAVLLANAGDFDAV